MYPTTYQLMKYILTVVSIAAIILAGLLLPDYFCEHQAAAREKAVFNYPGEWMDYQRSYPNDHIKPEAYLSAMEAAATLHKQTASRDIYWEFAGPENIGGRITDLAFHPDNPTTYYAGGASGGILKTTDGGQHWEQLFAGNAVISIGDLAIDPNNPEVIYAGTGEANASSYSFMGNGIYKSSDAGESWDHIGLTTSAYIGRIVVDYNNSDKIFVAACGNLFSYGGERGIYRSSNGGGDWEQVLYVNDSTSGIDLVQHPINPNIIYASMWQRTRGLTYRNSFGAGSGVWKSIDGGNSWTALSNGLPTGDLGRIGIDISTSNPDVLYAFIDMPDMEVGVYKSTNGGDNWSRVNDNVLDGMNSNFGWYFGQLRVDPFDENTLYVMGVDLYKSTNGGDSWTQLAGYFNSNIIHVDHHAMFIDPGTQRIYIGNDGGLFYSDNQGSNWTKINNIPLTQFYAIDIDYQFPERIYGGTQDNNTIRTTTGETDDWEAILGGDGMYCLVDYENNDNVYAESQWGGLSKSESGGAPGSFNYIAWNMMNDRTNWSAPLAMDPENPNRLYFGTYRIWRSLNGGDTWTAVSEDLTQGGSNYFHTITTIDVSSVNPNIVVSGSGDGKVFISGFGGNGWTDITGNLPDRWITKVSTDPFDENTIYVSLSGFRWDEATPHIFKTTDLGITWVSISGNLPDLPVNVLVADPEVEGWLYAGTDAGAFYTDNGGISWKSLMKGLPNVAVTSMKIHQPSRSLVMGTYGLSAYRLNLDYLVGSPEGHTKDDMAMEASAFPNPASMSSSIVFEVYLPNTQTTSASIYDINGREVVSLLDHQLLTGRHRLEWNADASSRANLAAGSYIFRITQGNQSKTLPFSVVR